MTAIGAIISPQVAVNLSLALATYPQSARVDPCVISHDWLSSVLCVLSILASNSAAEVSVHRAGWRTNIPTRITSLMTTIWAGRSPDLGVDFAIAFFTATLPPPYQRWRAGSSVWHGGLGYLFSPHSLRERKHSFTYLCMIFPLK
jgi:hypothetical protein